MTSHAIRPWATPCRLRELQLKALLKLPVKGPPLTARQRRRALMRERKVEGEADLFEGLHEAAETV